MLKVLLVLKVQRVLLVPKCAGAQGNQGVAGPTAGSNGQVVYNSGGSATGSSNLTFDGNHLTVGGNLNVGGVLTYEDVTNIDAIGIITARTDIHVGAGVSAVGILTASTADFTGTGAVEITSGTTAQRPSSPAAGMMRYNTDNAQFEVTPQHGVDRWCLWCLW